MGGDQGAGSTLASWLEQEGLREEVSANAAQRVDAWKAARASASPKIVAVVFTCSHCGEQSRAPLGPDRAALLRCAAHPDATVMVDYFATAEDAVNV